MTTGSVPVETISHRAITGTPKPHRIVITEWGNQYSVASFVKNDWSDAGRLWCKINGSTLNIYKRINPDGTFDSGDEVLRGSVAAGEIALAEQNSSGLSGTIYLDDADDGDLFDLIVTYADERDIEAVLNINDQASALDSAVAKILTETERWQVKLLEAKRRLDERLVADHGKQKYLSNVADGRSTYPFKLDAWGRWELAAIASPQQLARVHVYYALALLCEHRVTFHATFERLHDFYMKKAKEALADIRIIVDHEADQVVDTEAKTRSADRTLDRA